MIGSHTLHNVVRPRALRARCAREADHKRAASTVGRVNRSCSPNDVNGLRAYFCRVENTNGAVVLGNVSSVPRLLEYVKQLTYVELVVGSNAAGSCCRAEWCACNLIPGTKIGFEIELGVRDRVEARA